MYGNIIAPKGKAKAEGANMEKFLVRAENERTGDMCEMLVEDTNAIWAVAQATNSMAPAFIFKRHPYDDFTIKVRIVHE